MPLNTLRARFEAKYLPVLRYVTVDIADIVDPQVLAITDPDDVPTGQLAKLLAPCVVFSEDKHLRKPGLAPDEWRQVAEFAADMVEGITGQRVTGNLATLPLRGGFELTKFLGRKTGISPWLIGGIVVVGTVIVLKDKGRREAVGKYVLPVAEVFIKKLERDAALEQRGLTALREVLLPVLPDPDAKQQAAIVLARRHEPLLAREVQEQLLTRFDESRVPTIAEIRTALKDSSEFVQPERYRWQFGRAAGPWRGQLCGERYLARR